MKVKLVILDVDGVLNDGKKIYDDTGSAVYKAFNDKDFTAIKGLRSVGVRVVFLSGDRNVNEAIAKKRNIPFYWSRPSGIMIDKKDFVVRFIDKYDTTPDEMVYVGDDIFDIPILKSIGFPFCPLDAHPDVKSVATTLPVKGGDGVVMYLVEHLISKNEILRPILEDIIKLDRYETL